MALSILQCSAVHMRSRVTLVNTVAFQQQTELHVDEPHVPLKTRGSVRQVILSNKRSCAVRPVRYHAALHGPDLSPSTGRVVASFSTVTRTVVVR